MSNKENFLEDLADILEVDKSVLVDDYNFKNENFDSLKGYAILITVEEEFSKAISADDFIKINTIKELFDLIEA